MFTDSSHIRISIPENEEPNVEIPKLMPRLLPTARDDDQEDKNLVYELWDDPDDPV